MLNSGSCLAGGHDGNNDQPNGDGGGQQYEGTGGKKQLESSRLKKSSGNKDKADAAEDDYPNPKYCTNNTSGGTSVAGAPYCVGVGVGGGGGGYGNSSRCGGGGDGDSYGNSCPYGTGGNAPYNNAPAAFWAPQDGARSPLYINTQAVHVYGMPCVSNNDNNNDDDKRTKRGDGFFGPVFHAAGHFLDRKFGFDGRD
jgi:hypothetical protein